MTKGSDKLLTIMYGQYEIEGTLSANLETYEIQFVTDTTNEKDIDPTQFENGLSAEARVEIWEMFYGEYLK